MTRARPYRIPADTADTLLPLLHRALEAQVDDDATRTAARRWAAP